MSVEREMSLAEWCAKLPSLHLVNQELSTLNTQLAALAEQNEKMRAFVIKVSEQTPEKPDYWSSCGQCEHNSSNAEDLLELPDLASPVLNRIRAEGMRMAAEIVGPEDSHQDDWFKAKADSCAKLRAKADELEKSK